MTIPNRRIAVTLVVQLFFGLPGSAVAQAAAGGFRGTITRDSSRVPVEGVEIIVAGVGSALSSAEGKFGFGTIVPGLYDVTLRHAGYQSIEGKVRVVAGETKDLSFAIWPSRTEPTAEQAAAGETGPNSGPRGFERRRKNGSGKYLTPADFKGHENATLAALLRATVLFVHMPDGGTAISGRRTQGATNKPPACDASSMVMACAPGLEDQCYMQVWLDGQRLYTYKPETETRPPNLNEFAVANIVGVEVYRGTADTPPEFSTPGAACGTIAIWTGKW